MKKNTAFTLLILSAVSFYSCGKELIKPEEFNISTDINANSSKTNPGFKSLTSYTGENYSGIEKMTEEETKKEYEIIKSTDIFNSEKDKEEDKNWLKRDWPFALGILSVAAAAALIF